MAGLACPCFTNGGLSRHWTLDSEYSDSNPCDITLPSGYPSAAIGDMATPARTFRLSLGPIIPSPYASSDGVLGVVKVRRSTRTACRARGRLSAGLDILGLHPRTKRERHRHSHGRRLHPRHNRINSRFQPSERLCAAKHYEHQQAPIPEVGVRAAVPAIRWAFQGPAHAVYASSRTKTPTAASNKNAKIPIVTNHIRFMFPSSLGRGMMAEMS